DMPTHRLQIIGHRGAMGLAPENTLEGFEEAIQHGVDMIETDVHVSRDGQLVLNHDKHLTTADKQKLKIIDSHYPELKKHNSELVTLDEAIQHINHRARLMIEIKPGVDPSSILKTVQSYLDKGR